MTQLDNLVAVTLAKLVGTSRVVALPEWILYPLGGQINLLAASDLWDAEADVISKWESD